MINLFTYISTTYLYIRPIGETFGDDSMISFFYIICFYSRSQKFNFTIRC